MRILDCHEIDGATALLLDGRAPLTNWRKLLIGGIEYEPVAIMDMGKNVIAVKGSHDLTGKDVSFV